jgi:hypothetical protein
VAEDKARLIQRHAISQHLGGRCVAQQVRTFGWSIDVGAFESMFHDRGNPIPGCKRPARGFASHENVIVSDVRRPAIQISEKRIPDILRERQSHLVSPFPRYSQRAVVPVDVVETKSSHVSGAQSQSDQHQ